MRVRERVRWLLLPLAAFTVPVRALAQEDAGGFLEQNMTFVIGAVVLLVLVLILSRRRKGKPAAEAAAAAAEATDEELAPTTFSAMGLMSNAGGPLGGDYFIIKRTGLTIGRDPATCDVVYEDSSVSRQHARLEYTHDGLLLRNLSDTNQTFLNDEAVSEAAVKSGDRIRIENVTFKVLPHGSSE